MKRYYFGLALALLISQHAYAAGDVKRGKTLHDENCISCHANAYGGDGSGIYTRADRKIDSYEALQNQVMRCKTALGVSWPEDQIADVVAYLNTSFYKFKK
jgi:mono/diheme cytochrome c family protein